MTSPILRLLLSMLICLVLTIVPLPELLTGIRPPWILLLVLYIQFFVSEYFSLIFILLMGLTLDVLLSSVLGEHILALAFVSWIASTKARRFSLFSISQQMALIGFFCLVYQFIIFAIDGILGCKTSYLMLLANSFITILLWPWIKIFAEDFLFRRKYRR